MSTGDFAEACAAGDSAAVNRALRDRAALGPLDGSGVTPLHLAAAARSAEVVAALLGAGADRRAATTEEVAAGRWFADGGDAEFLAGSTPPWTASRSAASRTPPSYGTSSTPVPTSAPWTPTTTARSGSASAA
ncbi:hypothetical protein ACIRL2_38970 [Embleya sp. NPDC127516]|uniref:hypothetical protein n=1 Tax=Embleya sp. NPDC127516 TaxID=3363990 RepID=UPI00381F74DE